MSVLLLVLLLLIVVCVKRRKAVKAANGGNVKNVDNSCAEIQSNSWSVPPIDKYQGILTEVKGSVPFSSLF